MGPMTTQAPVLAGIRPLPHDTLSFAPDVAVRAFVVERDHGNILVYTTEHTADAVAGHDIQWHYLNHWHEAMWGLDDVAHAHGAPIVIHADDHDEADRTANGETRLITFDERHTLGEGFELIPIPGHTAGATAFLYERAGHRFLFTGDSLYLRDGEWIAAVLPTSDRARYLESLDLIRGLDFDVLVPWGATVGDPFYAVTDEHDRHERITKIMNRLWSGEDH
jgi:glyoxylase-like metal-dependent hydrolase (beta-lactamase superfamily II)